ncbi:MAG: hypothetical protein AAES65_02300 [Candidatus Thiodiazotropha sp. (ex. Lucinoma kazani)]
MRTKKGTPRGMGDDQRKNWNPDGQTVGVDGHTAQGRITHRLGTEVNAHIGPDILSLCP